MGVSIFRFDNFEIDLQKGAVTKSGQAISLEPKAFRVLVHLIENRERLIEKSELLDAVWKETFVTENAMTRLIAQLRRALGDDAKQPKYILTLPTRGYRFIAEVRESGAHTTATRERHQELVVRSIAVLPFKPLGVVEPNDEYLGPGMADVLITKLSKLPQVAVRSTSSILRFNSAGQDPTEVGRQLGVDAVLDGHIQKSGERIRVTTQLINVRDESSLWAETFDERFTDIFSVEDSISTQVTAALTLRLTGAERAQLTKRHTEDSAAHREYLRGRYHWSKRTKDGLNKAIESFQRAIAIDSDFALAYSGIADCYVILGNYSILSPVDSFPKAKTAANKALELDESLAEAHASLAFTHYQFDWNGPAAENEFKRAIELGPRYATAHDWFAAYLLTMDRTVEADAEIERAQEHDPLSPIITIGAARHFYLTRRYERTIEECRKALEIDPQFFQAHAHLGLAYEQQGRFADAISEFEKARSLEDNPYVIAALGHAYGASRQRSKALDVLEQLHELSHQRYVSPFHVALVYAGLGETVQALDWLESAHQNRSAWLVFFKAHPYLDAVRDEPRFVNLLASMNLFGARHG
jgi:DNA-binding winged helix-turn-helix (wHTH) protein/tetratricopeptide (TPR) repeat protein